jgi:3-dehydroquinate dehydratase/shikimate dehydrogenase
MTLLHAYSTVRKFRTVANLFKEGKIVIQTERLILREWQETDLEPFAKLNADPRVMEYFPSTLSREESDQLAKRLQGKIQEKGWGFWAVSVPDLADFIGFIGLNYVDQSTLPAPFTPAVEIGWRLAFDHWGKGYAVEGAKAALAYGFKTLHLKEIVSFTAVENRRSRRVMEKIEMHRDPKDDFQHPKIPEGHALKRHVLYRLSQPDWRRFHSESVDPIVREYS